MTARTKPKLAKNPRPKPAKAIEQPDEFQLTPQLLPVDALRVSPLNARAPAPAEDRAIADLARSIAVNGLLHPIVCRRRPDGDVEVLAGSRRLAACKTLGLETIPAAVIVDLDDQSAAAIVAAENIHREDLSPLEQAAEIERLLQTGLTIEQTAAAISQTPYFVASRRKLANLSEVARDAFASGDNPELQDISVLLWLATLPKELQDQAIDFDITVQPPDDRRRWAATQLRSHALRSAPWNTSDAELLPMAGACDRCPKRTGAERYLWPDLVAPEQDSCLDTDCWEQKHAAHLLQRIEQEKRTSDQPPLLLHRQPLPPDLAEHVAELGAAAAMEHEVVRCPPESAKSDARVRKALTMDGETVFVRPIAYETSSGRKAIAPAGAKPTEKSPKQRRLELQRRRLAEAVRLFREALDIEECGGKNTISATDVIRLAAVFGVLRSHATPYGADDESATKRLWADFDLLKTEADAVERLWTNVRGLLLQRLRIVGPITSTESAERAWRECERIAAVAGMRPRHFLDEAELAIKEPKSLKAAAEGNGKRNSKAKPDRR